jgi:hypothetical protein
MFFKDEVTDVLPLDREHRKKWFNATGLLLGLDAEETEKTLELFNGLLDNWEQYKKYHDIYEYMLPMVRRAINYLYSEDSIIWSIKMDKKRLYVYRHNFSLPDYVEHFDRLYKSSIRNIRDNFKNIDAEAEVCHLCIRDYFYHLSNVSKAEDYESIIRDTKLTKLIEE